MNYTGFGTDPNLIYSFRQTPMTGPAMGSGQYMDRFAGLRGSIAYRQADPRGRRRMEQAVEMGLPANTDISRVQRTGAVGMDRRPVYVAPRPMAFGTWEGDPKTGLLTGPMSDKGIPVSGGYGSNPEDRPSRSFSKDLGWSNIPKIPFIGSFY